MNKATSTRDYIFTMLMRSALGLLIICFSFNDLFAQVYTTKADGAWNNPSTWVSGIMPGSTIEAGKIVNIKHDVSYNLSNDLYVYGTLSIIDDTLRFPSSSSVKVVVGNSGKLLVERAGLNMNLQANKIHLKNEGGYISIVQSNVSIGKDFESVDGGRRKVKESNLVIGGKYRVDGSSSITSRDTLENSTVITGYSEDGTTELKDYTSLVAANVRFYVTKGKFTNDSKASVTLLAGATNYYAFNILKLENDLSNDGIWTARIDAYCIDGSINGSRVADIDFTRPEDCSLAQSPVTHGQLVINEVYTDPASGNHEFIELYNIANVPESIDSYTLLTFFATSTEKGFYVLDFPDHIVSPFGFYVASSALPFNIQGLTGSNASNLSWSSLIGSTTGYLKKWVVSSDNNILDGNSNYNIASLPVIGFNDLFPKISGDITYTFLLYKNGILVNQIIAGAGGDNSISSTIATMPKLNITAAGKSPNFTVDFSDYVKLPMEKIIPDAGTDNGYFRTVDGGCGTWKKASSSPQHSPMKSNGAMQVGTSGEVKINSSIVRGTSTTPSILTYSVASAPSTAFPVTMTVYLDNGLIAGQMDINDKQIDRQVAGRVGETFNVAFTPYNANILMVVRQGTGCLNSIQMAQSSSSATLAVNFVDFTASWHKTYSALEWNAVADEFFSHFMVERSNDGRSFSSVARIDINRSSATPSYTYGDHVDNPLPVYYYRIKGVDLDGKITMSQIKMVKTGNDAGINLAAFPNPTDSKVSVAVPVNWQGKQVNWQVVDLTGAVHFSKVIPTSSSSAIFELNMLRKGVYMLRARCGSAFSTVKIIKY